MRELSMDFGGWINMNKKITSWLIPFAVALGLFLAVRPSLAQLGEGEAQLEGYLSSNAVEVGEETVEDRRQVYYVVDGKKIFITEGNLNSRQPDADGEYVTFVTDVNGAGQVFLHHIPSGADVQLTNSSTNLQPEVSSSGMVVWERWIDEGWQIFLFDGKSIKQLTSGDVSVNADIEGDRVVYARQGGDGEWRAVMYTISSGESQEIARGVEAKRPRFENGRVVFGFEKAKKTEDVATPSGELAVDLPVEGESTSSGSPSAVLQTVTEEEIMEELEATPSGETATPSAEVSEESTPSADTVEEETATLSGEVQEEPEAGVSVDSSPSGDL